MQNSLQQAGTN